MTTDADVILDTTRDEGTFTSPQAPGVTFHRIAVVPRDPSHTRARLAVVHGYGDHAGRYVEAMGWLAGRGVACHAVDLRGHGRSSGRRAYVRKWDEYLDDLAAFLALPELAPAPPGEPPRFLLGHSHGALIVALAGIRTLLDSHGIAGCILSAPYLVNAHPVPRYKAAAARVLNVLWPSVRISSGVTAGLTSSDPAMIEDSRHDALLLRCATPRWFIGVRGAQREAIDRAGEFKLPLLVLQGDADAIADPSGAQAFHALAGSADKSFVAYPGFRHEPLREAGRDRVFADVLAWIEARVSVPPTGEPSTSFR